MNLDYFPDTYWCKYWSKGYWQYLSVIIEVIWRPIRYFEVILNRTLEREFER